MPVIAVMGAVAGASALAAGGLSAFGTISAIGGIVGGIGALTGNKDMMKIGAVAGIAGGVGAFASGQGWIGGDSPSSSGGGDVGGSVGSEAGMSLESGMGSIGDNMTQANNAANGTMGMGDWGPDGGSLMSAPSIMPEPSAVPTSGIPSAANKVVGDWGPNAPPGMQQQTPDSGGIFGALGKFGDYFKSMDKDTKSILANFVGGAFDGEKKAKTDYYKTAAETQRKKMENGSAVPKFDFKLTGKDSVFKQGPPPVYNAPQMGLYYAK